MNRELRSIIAAVACLMGAASGCDRSHDSRAPANQTAATEPWFEDVTAGRHLTFVHDAGPMPEPATAHYFYPQIMGSGAALFDYDDDGRLDIYLVQNSGPGGRKNQLFHQNADGTFRDVSAGSGLDVAGYGMGVAIGDVNNDGYPDLLLTEYGRIRLFLNHGDGKFTDITTESGLDDPHWATAAAFVDYDRDGRLDLVVTHYLQYDPTRACRDRIGQGDYCGPGDFPGAVTRLFHNNGAAGGSPVRFEDVTESSKLSTRAGAGLGVVCLDFNGDGWPDIFVTNDGRPNHLWINQHDGTFTEEAIERGLAFNGLGAAPANMGIATGDLSGNGLFSLYVTHLGSENNTLWTPQPVGFFQDRTGAAGLDNTAWHGTGFGTALVDVANDGRLALVVVNGRVRRRSPGEASPAPSTSLASGGKAEPHWSQYAERNQILENYGGGKFHDISEANPAFCGIAAVWRGLVVGDLFNDGGIDLLATTAGGEAHLFRNALSHRGHWVVVRAIDPALHRDAYGARISLSVHGQHLTRWINPAGSYLSSNDPRAHFGVGGSDRVEQFDVLWPDGVGESFPGSAADRIVVLRRGQGRPKPTTGPARGPASAALPTIFVP